MTQHQYRAIGFFYIYYDRNLQHIANFHQFKKNQISFDSYLNDEKNSFRKFLSEFRVIRNVKKDKQEALLKLTRSWIKTKNFMNVDKFAKEIKKKGINHKGVAASLASKILHLDTPHKILPLDSQVKKTIKHNNNIYSEFLAKVIKYRRLLEVQECLKYVDEFAIQIEKKYQGKISNIKTVRLNRMLDIYLWAKNGN